MNYFNLILQKHVIRMKICFITLVFAKSCSFHNEFIACLYFLF